MTATSADHRALRDVYGRIPSGVATVCALVGGRPIGMVVSTLVGISLEPPIVAASFQSGSRTWAALREAPSLGVSVLGCRQRSVATRLSSKAADRFDEVEWWSLDSGEVLVGDALAWMQVRLLSTQAVGDHDLALFELAGAPHGDRLGDEPMVFFGSEFRRLAELQPLAGAPGFVEPEPEG